MPVDLDPPTKAIMAAMAADGFLVTIGQDDNSRVIASAQGPNGETWQLWAADAYAAGCGLAGQIGFDLAGGRCKTGRPSDGAASGKFRFSARLPSASDC